MFPERIHCVVEVGRKGDLSASAPVLEISMFHVEHLGKP